MTKKPKEKYTGPRVKDTETFIQKARWVHGDEYDYSKVEYVNAKTKVEIVCPEHGGFTTTPDNHLSSLKGGGCKGCRYVGINSQTQQEFIQKAKLAHNYKYGYGSTEYTKSTDKVKIECPVHGFFYQEATAHLRGAGCAQCFRERQFKTEVDWEKTREFIERAREVHGDKYGYDNSLVISAQQRHKIEITCPVHGKFYQTYHKHLSRGCQKCAGRNLDNNDIIEVFRKSHGDLYDYSNVEYKGCNTVVSIVCKKHGTFEQLPVVHRQGRGCPSCADIRRQTFYQTTQDSNLYVLMLGCGFIKVGLAIDISARMRQINRESNYSVEKLYSISGKANELFDLEQKILRQSGLERYCPEVSFGGQSECLELSELPKVLQIIEEWEKEQKFEEDA